MPGNWTGSFHLEEEILAGLMERIGESVRGRRVAANLDAVEDEIRRFILQKLAHTGKAPSLQEIGEWVGGVSTEFADRVVNKLARADILTRKGGEIVSAYPFSVHETRHRVAFDDGRRVYALCATDALGIHFILNEPITIFSRCPWCEGETKVVVGNGRIEYHSPAGMLEFVSEQERCGCTAETCCPYINFFCSEDHLARWREKNPGLANGEKYSLDEALQHGKMIFGDSLR